MSNRQLEILCMRAADGDAWAQAELRKLAESGAADLQTDLGLIYQYHDDTEAVKWFRMAAEQGDAEAVKWYSMAVKLEHPFVQYDWGERFEFGKDVPQDLDAANHLFSLAAEQGYRKAMDAIVCSFGNNIYELTLLGEGADIVSVLREQLEGSEENPLKDITTSSAFAEIYLFFDYDLHHRLPLDEINRRLDEMLVLFDDETTNGKLYINYPMIESIRYTKELPDADYYLYTIPKNECGGFKRIAHCFSAYGSLDFLTDTREQRIN